MHIYPRWIQGRTTGEEDSLTLLGAPPHGGPSRELLRHPIKRIPRVHPGGTTTPQNIQRGGGCHYTELGIYGL